MAPSPALPRGHGPRVGSHGCSADTIFCSSRCEAHTGASAPSSRNPPSTGHAGTHRYASPNGHTLDITGSDASTTSSESPSTFERTHSGTNQSPQPFSSALSCAAQSEASSSSRPRTQAGTFSRRTPTRPRDRGQGAAQKTPRPGAEARGCRGGGPEDQERGGAAGHRGTARPCQLGPSRGPAPKITGRGGGGQAATRGRAGRRSRGRVLLAGPAGAGAVRRPAGRPGRAGAAGLLWRFQSCSWISLGGLDGWRLR
mmetsp:Transcript_106892/g.312511  ORF Transcript_106892/g.312511 Transcript_106892/m.312511 type:complete len:256 (+) Transcript_106892:1578-2345(+)